MLSLTACGRIAFDRVGDAGFAADASNVTPDAFPISNLVAWWPLDDDFPSSGVALDHSGNGLDAMCSMCPVTAPGRPNGRQAARFDGVDDILLLTARASINFPAGFTAAGWIKLERLAIAPVEILVSRAVGVGGQNSFSLNHNSANRAEYFSEGGSVLEGTSLLVLDQWIHLAATYDGTTKRIYVNGARENSQVTGIPVTYDAQPLTIGGDIENNTPAFFLQGTIADVMLFDRRLLDGEIQMLALP